MPVKGVYRALTVAGSDSSRGAGADSCLSEALDNCEVVRQATLDGARIVQFREKEARGRELVEMALAVRQITRKFGAYCGQKRCRRGGRGERGGVIQ